MSHSKALSRLTVGDRRSDLIGTAENDWDVRARLELRDMIDARMHPIDKYALGHGNGRTPSVGGGRACTFVHAGPQAAEAAPRVGPPRPHWRSPPRAPSRTAGACSVSHTAC